MRHRALRTPIAPSGITLIETLVAILVVGILLLLIFTGLRSAMHRTDDTRTLAGLRTGLQMFSSWSDDRKGENLNAGFDPQRYSFRRGPGPRGAEVTLTWRAQSLQQQWAHAWHWTTGEPPTFGGFSYCWTYLTDPPAWSEPRYSGYLENRWRFEGAFRATMRHEVAYPASKAMLVTPVDPTTTLVTGPTRFATGLSDGSARIVLTADHLVPQLSDPQWGLTRADWPGYGTPGGLHGRDIR